MDDDVVDGDADGPRVALVALGRGHAAAGTDELVGDPVELEGRHPWLDPLPDVRDRLADQRARATDAVDLRRAFADDHAASPSSSRSSAASISVETSSIDRAAWSGTSFPVAR